MSLDLDVLFCQGEQQGLNGPFVGKQRYTESSRQQLCFIATFPEMTWGEVKLRKQNKQNVCSAALRTPHFKALPGGGAY